MEFNNSLTSTDPNHMLEKLRYIRKLNERLHSVKEEYLKYNNEFHKIINEHALLASYSNIFVILFASLKELSKITGEVTYSWRVYLKLLDMIIAKIIRDLTMNLKSKDDESEEGEGESDSEQEKEVQHYSDRPRKKKKRSEKKDRGN